jgi:hypothetical protein
MASSPSYSLAAALGRLTWMVLGPMALLLTAFTVASTGNGWLTPWDFGYFAVLTVMLLGRCLEFREGNPQTADGQPATMSHLRRYLLVAGAIGLVVWVAANLIGN